MNAYSSAQLSAVWRNLSHFGRFRFSGADAATLLHHLTTNDIKKLKSGESCEAALVNHKARVLDWLTVLRRGDELLVITSPNRRAMLKPHAEKFILFRQDVKIEDITENTALWGVLGPRAEEFLPEDASIIRTPRLPFSGCFVWSDSAGRPSTVQTNAIPDCDDETYNQLRIEAGLPVAGLELTENINPWEAGLDFAISLHKGCYNGQEVVARLNTYKKVKQGLMGLSLERAIPMAQLVSQPVKLQADGRDAGFITSSVQSPRFGAIALGFVKGDYQNAGQELTAQTPDGAQTVTVRELPFSD
jgi:folate-binding protein YgfZ